MAKASKPKPDPRVEGKKFVGKLGRTYPPGSTPPKDTNTSKDNKPKR